MKDHNTYLCDDCGLGKTLMAIETIKAMGVNKGLIVCLKSARLQWKQAFEEQMPGVEVILPSHLKYRFDEIDAFFVVGFDELDPRSLLYMVAKVVWPVMIIDEAHKLKNKNTKRSKNIPNLTGARRIAMSATPIEKHGGELWPLLKWLAPEKFPAYWTWVQRTFEVKPGFYGGFDIGDPIDPVAYQAEVSPWVIRRTMDTVMSELPELIETVVPLQMPGAQLVTYKQVAEAKDALVRIHDRDLLIENALSLFTRLHQICSMPSMLFPVVEDNCKFDWLTDFLGNHKDMRVLVFSRYRDVVEAVRRKYDKYGVSRVIGGAQGVNESDDFKNGKGRILAGTIDAMSESLSLEMADAAIFLDQHWSATQMYQAKRRIYRMNITSAKLVYYLQASKVDKKVMNVVDKKYDDQEMLLDFVNEEFLW